MSDLEERVTQLEIRHTYSEETIQTLSETPASSKAPSMI